MLPEKSEKALAGLKRLNGLSGKVEELIEEDAYCPEILRNVLAMKGHLDYIQTQVLESHLQTCAAEKLSSSTEKEEFTQELLKVIGLSTR